MATGGENFSYSIGSEDFYDSVCDPCQEDGELYRAVGMCIDCKDHLCQKCFDAHKIARPFRKHELLGKEAMLQSQVSITKDKCTEKCAVHEEEVIKYYCINHSCLGCSVCITLDHRSCDSVRYIPHVAKDLANNKEYQQVKSQLMSVVERSKKVTKHNKQTTESLEKDCSDAVKMVQKFRKDINEVLDTVEAELLKQCETIKSEEAAKITQIVHTLKTTLKDLHALMDMKQAYENNNQNCNLYTLLMKTKDKVQLAEERMTEVANDQSKINIQIKFVANKETLNTLKLPETLGKLETSETPNTTRIRQEQTKTTEREKLPESPGTLLTSETSQTIRPAKTKTTESEKKQKTSVKKAEAKRIVRAEYVQDINVQYKTDNEVCNITGLAILPDNRLVATDYNNSNVKLVDVMHSQVITCLKLSSEPWDVTMVTNCQVAIAMPHKKKIAMVNVTATAMTVGSTVKVDGKCWGVDYRDGKLAVSFWNPHKVRVITLQGRVLHSITTNQHGHNLFNTPHYVVFGQDNNSLYVSDEGSHKLVNVKFDGTLVGTYTDNELSYPRALLIDRSGHVYVPVCGMGSLNIHQITPDCRKVQVLKTMVDDLYMPHSISYSETDCRLYVGMMHNNVVKVYGVILDPSE